MPDEKTLNIVIQLLQSKKNNAEITKLEKNLKSMHSNLTKINKAFNSKGASKEMSNLRSEVNKVSKSLKDMFKGQFTNLKTFSKNIGKTTDLIEKMIISIKRSKGVWGTRAREDLPALEAIHKSLIGLREEVEKLDAADRKALKVKKEASIQATKNAETLKLQEVATKSVAGASAEASSRLLQFSNIVLESANRTLNLISVTNELERSLREIQALGSLRGTSMFSQNIQSIKLFIGELEKLRIKLANIMGEGLSGRSSGITEEMVRGFRKLATEINKTEGRITELQKTFRKMKDLAGMFNEMKRGLTGVVTEGKKIGTSIEGSRLSVEKLGAEFIELKGKGSESANKIVSKFNELSVSLAANLNKVGTVTLDAASDMKTFDNAVKTSITKIIGDFEKLGISATTIMGLYNKSIDQMIVSINKFGAAGRTGFKSNQEAMTATERVIGNVAQKMEVLDRNFVDFLVVIKLVEKGVLSYAEGQKVANNLMKEASGLLGVLTSKNNRLAKDALNVASSFSQQVITINMLKKTMRDAITSVDSLARRQRILEATSNRLGKTTPILNEQFEFANRTVSRLTGTYITLVGMLEKLTIAGKGTSKEAIRINRYLDLLGKKSQIAGVEVRKLSTELQQASSRAGDFSRAIHRVSSEGFAAMIISQAAWMMGFQVIFGTLDKFKSALEAVKETQLAVSRAMRTIRSDLYSQAEIYEKLTDIINDMRISVGASAAETGEALYQLGSAGLSLKESLAALAPTMDTVIGSEADMEQITNLVAGVYNNFGDQIVKIDGRIGTISNTFDEYNTKLVESASLTEKFTHINDLLIRTFDAHQAEMAQIRDGLKFMAQSAKVANISLTEQLGILATLHDHLIKAGAAGRGMRVIISRISKEADAFKKAFDIEIDLSKPIAFMDILSQLSVKIKDQTLSVDKLGQFFKKLGLRGVEPLLVLIQYFDELNFNIKDLTENSKNAAKAMRLIRLDNIGDQAKLATGRIEVFMKKGLEPLADLSLSLIRIFNYVGDIFLGVNKIMKGWLGTLIKVVGFTALLAGIAVAVKNLGAVARWVQGVFVHLAATVTNFGTSVFIADKKIKTFSATLYGAITSTTSYAASVKQATVSQYALSSSAAGVTRSMAVMQGALAGLRTAWTALSAILKTIVWVAVFIAIEKIISYLMGWENRIREVSKALKADAMNQKENLSSLIELREKMVEAVSTTGEWTLQLKLLASQLGIDSGHYATAGDALEDMKKKLDEVIEKQKEMADASKMEYIRNEFERLKTTVGKSTYEFFEASNHVGILSNAMFTLKEKIEAGNERIKILNASLNFLNNNTAPDDLIAKFKEMGDVSEKDLVTVRKLIEGWNEERVAQGKTAIATEDHKAKVQALINTYREKIDGMEKDINLSEKQIKAITKAEKAYVKAQRAVNAWIKGLNELRSSFEQGENDLTVYTDAFDVLNAALSKSKFNFEVFKEVIEKTNQTFKKLSEEKAFNNFSDKLEKAKVDLDQIETAFNNLDKAVGRKSFLKVLKDLQNLQSSGFEILNLLYSKLEKISESLSKLEKRKISISLEVTNRNITETKRIVDHLKTALDRLRASGTANTYDLARASRQYRSALKDQEKTLRGAIDTAQKQIDKSKGIIDAQEKVANSEKKTVEERRRALERIEKELEKQKGLYQRILDANAKADAAKKASLEEDLARGRIFQADFNRRMRLQDQKHEESRKKINDIMDDIAAKREKTLDKLGPLYKDEFDSVQKKIQEVLSGMGEIQTLASKGIDLNSSSIDEAIKKADELHDNLKRTVTKTVYVKEVPKKYHGGVIGRAKGGSIPAMVTAGEGYIPPRSAMKNMDILNTLNGGRSTSKVPASISKFHGPGGVDNIQASLPVGSYVLSERGMEAYDKSIKEGATPFQEGGEVIDTDSIEFAESSERENLGSFTIIIQKGDTTKEFPVTGDISVLQQLQQELEEDQMVKLN